MQGGVQNDPPPLPTSRGCGWKRPHSNMVNMRVSFHTTFKSLFVRNVHKHKYFIQKQEISYILQVAYTCVAVVYGFLKIFYSKCVCFTVYTIMACYTLQVAYTCCGVCFTVCTFLACYTLPCPSYTCVAVVYVCTGYTIMLYRYITSP